MQLVAPKRIFGGKRHRAELVTVETLVVDVMGDDDVGLGVHGALRIVAPSEIRIYDAIRWLSGECKAITEKPAQPYAQ